MRTLLFFLLIQSGLFAQSSACILWKEDSVFLDPSEKRTPEVVWDLNPLLDEHNYHSALQEVVIGGEESGALVLTTVNRVENNTITGWVLEAVPPTGRIPVWKYSPSVMHTLGNSLEVVPDGNRLYVAAYCNIASGSDLVCVDLKTGNEVWQADVEQLIVEHSKYGNRVHLRKFGNVLALFGHEMGGDYLQLFDAATGKRLFSTLDHH